MQNYRIEKRIPFGFKGEWGKLYKQYNFEEKTTQKVVKWNETAYVDLGQDVQLKYLEDGTDMQRKPVQPVENRVTDGEYRIVETTDSYFDSASRNFECIAGLGDIVFAFGEWWVVDSIDDKSIFTPAKQTFYFVALKRIQERIVSAE